MQVTQGFELVREVMATASAFERESQRLFRPFGLTAVQFNVLNVLAGQSRGLSQRELSDTLVVDRSNVTGLVDRLVKLGWVRRAADPADRRIHRIELTAAGRRIWQKVQPRFAEVVAQVAGGIDERVARTALVALKNLQSGAAEWRLPGEQSK